MTTHECFQKAERIEAIAHEIYTRLASEFAGDAAAAADFRTLADEEAQHAKRIQLLGRTMRGKVAFTSDALPKQELEEGLAQAEQLLVEVAAGAWGRDLDQVTERMLAMEERFAVFHAEMMARSADPSVQKLFDGLAKQDRHHKALIEQIRKRRQAAG